MNGTDLPTYNSKATTEERDKQLELIAEQMRLLHEQEKIGVPLMNAKIRCCCNKLLPWWLTVKCLYCSIFYCPDCAEEHFGMRRKVIND